MEKKFLLPIAVASCNPFLLSDDAAEQNIKKFHLIRRALNQGMSVWCYPFEDQHDLYEIKEIWLDPRDHINARGVDPSNPEILLDNLPYYLEPDFGTNSSRPRKPHWGYVAYAEAYDEYTDEDDDGDDDEE